FFYFQAEDGIRDFHVTGVQTCALPISPLDHPWVPVHDRLAPCSELGNDLEGRGVDGGEVGEVGQTLPEPGVVVRRPHASRLSHRDRKSVAEGKGAAGACRGLTRARTME